MVCRECDLETSSRMRRPWPETGRNAKRKKKVIHAKSGTKEEEEEDEEEEEEEEEEEGEGEGEEEEELFFIPNSAT